MSQPPPGPYGRMQPPDGNRPDFAPPPPPGDAFGQPPQGSPFGGQPPQGSGAHPGQPTWSGPPAGSPEQSWPQSPGGRPNDPTAPLTGTPQAPPTGRLRPKRRKAPTIITLAVLVLALAVVGSLALYARHRAQVTTPPVAPAPTNAPAPTPATNSIAFHSSEGDGTLTVITHAWTASGDPEPTNGNYLQVQVELSVTEGLINYGPYYFGAFDAKGQLFETVDEPVRQPALDSGVLDTGEKARGYITFDIKRGDTTLLLGGPDSEAIAALKIKG